MWYDIKMKEKFYLVGFFEICLKEKYGIFIYDINKI